MKYDNKEKEILDAYKSGNMKLSAPSKKEIDPIKRSSPACFTGIPLKPDACIFEEVMKIMVFFQPNSTTLFFDQRRCAHGIKTRMAVKGSLQ